MQQDKYQEMFNELWNSSDQNLLVFMQFHTEAS